MQNDVMKIESASERAVALMHEALDVMRRTECAPDSPVNTFLTGEVRRKCRRIARRLREQKAEPRYKNLHSAEELAGMYERAAQRDEIREQGQKDLQRIARELKRISGEKDPEVEKAMVTLVDETARLADEHGPGSEAAQRFRLLQFLNGFGKQVHDRRRKSRTRIFPAGDPSIQARYELTAAEVLDSPPPDEEVISIPPEGQDSGRPRIFLRIGLGDASWIGSFEIGRMSVSTIVLMPGDRHLFVSAEGAGYIIDLKSRTLVEAIGIDVTGVMSDDLRTVFIVDHNGMSLEAFGENGRLWKTDAISCEGFRDTAITDTHFAGEARHPSSGAWTRFCVELATGEVRWYPAE